MPQAPINYKSELLTIIDNMKREIQKYPPNNPKARLLSALSYHVWCMVLDERGSNRWDLSRFYYEKYKPIADHMDLPELLFVDHVINKIRIEFQDSHYVRKEILPLALELKKAMVTPSAHAVQGIGFLTFALGVLGARSNVGSFAGISAGLLMTAFSEQIVNLRVATSLENQIALKTTGGRTYPIGDTIDKIIDTATNTYLSVTSFFQPPPSPPAVAASQKQPRRA